MSKRDVLLMIHNFSELKSLANNAKIRSSLKFVLLQQDRFFLDYLSRSESTGNFGAVGMLSTIFLILTIFPE